MIDLMRVGIAAASLSLTACDGGGEQPTPSDDAIRNAPQIAEARKDVAEGLRCMRLLAAIATASSGPLRDQIERAGLGRVEPGLARRWADRVRQDARRGGLSADETERLIAKQAPDDLDTYELRASAQEARRCAAVVGGSRA